MLLTTFLQLTEINITLSDWFVLFWSHKAYRVQPNVELLYEGSSKSAVELLYGGSSKSAVELGS
jgi:hypothetical protein